VLDRRGHRARRSRPGHHAVGGAFLAVAAVQPGQAGHRRTGAVGGVPGTAPDPGLRLHAARGPRCEPIPAPWTCCGCRPPRWARSW
jgi:hypothetical protein